MLKLKNNIIFGSVVVVLTFLVTLLIELILINQGITVSFLLLNSSLLMAQGIMTLIWLTYAWENPDEEDRSYNIPINIDPPYHSFTALVPVRHEEKVIADTIRAIDSINYPDSLKEIIIIVRNDDHKTKTVIENTLKELSKINVKMIVLINSHPINKPNQLNAGLKSAKGDIVCIFDAEDEPHKDLYKIINSVYLNEKVDIVQGGVQLMNYKDSWFSLINVLEYFFWFKSGLLFFTQFAGVSPLGGNTVFFKKKFLQKINGWDESALTEDADIGFRLSSRGAKTKVIYHPKLSTKEETPRTIESFIKQRTRWSQGFFQLITKADWIKLPTLKQKLLTLYVLSAPATGLMAFLFIPIGLVIGISTEISVWLTIFTYIPLLILMLIICAFAVGYYEFVSIYNFKFNPTDILKIIFYFVPYSFLIAISSLRALSRVIIGNSAWEKTAHFNSHRENAYYLSKN